MDQENVVFIHMEFYSATKNNEILSFASKWMEWKNINLSEISQPQKAKNICSPSYAEFQPKIDAVILNMGHTLSREQYRRNKER
jgi:hypothetical protein